MSDTPPRKRMRAGDTDRDAVLHVLKQAHADGRLSLEEMGERQDQVLRATFLDQISGVMDDLPEGRELVTAESNELANRRPGRLAATGKPETTTVTFMSGKDITIRPGTHLHRNFAWWGGDDIDLTAVMGPDVVLTLELHAVMAGHNIYVPEGVCVVDESLAIMAGNDIHREARGDGSNGTVILKGFLWWAGHDVKPAAARRD